VVPESNDVIVGILIALLGSCIGLINFLTQTRRESDKKLTGWGITVVTLSLAVFGLSGWRLWQDSEREKTAPYVLADSDIDIRLTASVVGETPSDDLQAHTPSAIEVGVVIPNEGGWTCILEAVPGFLSSGPGRGPAVAQRVYFTKVVRSIGNTKFKYLWDLSGRKIRIRNPKYSFSDLSRGELVKSWTIDLILRIKGREFRADNSSAYWLEFVLGGLDRNTIVGPSREVSVLLPQRTAHF
jgi:hypothetical protein